MKLALFKDGRPAVITDRGVVDVSAATASLGVSGGQETMKAIISNYDSLKSALEQAAASGPAVPLAEAQLSAPLPRPRAILAMGGNFRENGHREPSPMWGFNKRPEAVVGPGDTIVLPDVDANIFHHEAEMVLVFGKAGKSIKSAEAMDYVFGYTCGMDVSARMPAGAGGGGGREPNTLPVNEAKSHPSFAPLGPYIATKDEIANPQDTHVRLWVDGELRPDYSTSDMAHSIEDSIEYLTSIQGVEPGDVMYLGTNHQGLGALQDGDNVEIEIDGIGRMALKVSDPLKRRWTRGVDELTAQDVREGTGGPGQKQRPLS